MSLGLRTVLRTICRINPLSIRATGFNLRHISNGPLVEPFDKKKDGYESDIESSSSSESSSDSDVDEVDGHLYETHVPTTMFQKSLLTIGSAVAAITDPYRDDMVAVLGETTGHRALSELYRKMSENDEGCRILQDRPTINTNIIDYDALLQLPLNTFGFQYATFMQEKRTADTRKPVKFVDDADLAYVMRRYRETHDLVHSLLGMRTNMLGEVTVKWVEAIQTNLPMAWTAAIFGATRLAPKQRKAYTDHLLPWGIKCGHQAELLMNVYFEKRFEQDVDELRLELNIPALPLEHLTTNIRPIKSLALSLFGMKVARSEF
ncbi:Ubiquinone biosynthesis protein COQ4 -like protein, mitochondrial [Halotydeus destructor]|nr:Ubiquinone biosynthesis protein COQ4 -like protein, mitochondrial [Halotydeus destructor]